MITYGYLGHKLCVPSSCTSSLPYLCPETKKLCVEHGGNVGEATWYVRYCNLHGFVSAEVNTSAAGSV